MSIREALLLVNNQETFINGLDALRKIALNFDNDIDTRFKAMTRSYDHLPDHGLDILRSIRDCMACIKTGKPFKDLVTLVFMSANDDRFPIHERMLCAMTLYNSFEMIECYKAFKNISEACRGIYHDTHDTFLLNYYTECAKFLICSENNNFIDSARDILFDSIDYLENLENTKQRYDIVITFNSRSGVKSFLNQGKIKIPFDPILYMQMQSRFFIENRNLLMYRLLSGQSILQTHDNPDIANIFDGYIESDLTIDSKPILQQDPALESKSPQDSTKNIKQYILSKKSVADAILYIADPDPDCSIEQIIDLDIEEKNRRGDAADIILRIGDESQRQRARTIITRLGATREKIKSIYTDGQNAHMESVEESVERFIDAMVASPPANLLKFDKVLDMIMRYLKESYIVSVDADKDASLDASLSASVSKDTQTNSSADTEKRRITPKDRLAVLKSLNRVEIDTATFTKHNFTLADIFVHIWSIVEKSKDSSLLKSRMIEELIEMADICSSGYAARFLLVVAIEDSIRNILALISWKDQIESNYKGRMDAKIRDCKDETIKNALVMGCMAGAEEEDARIYNEFITIESNDIVKELYNEFVTAGHVEESLFNSVVDELKKEHGF